MIKRTDVHWEYPPIQSVENAGGTIDALALFDDGAWDRVWFTCDANGVYLHGADDHDRLICCVQCEPDAFVRMTGEEADACIREHGYDPDVCRHCGIAMREDGARFCSACTQYWDERYQREIDEIMGRSNT